MVWKREPVAIIEGIQIIVVGALPVLAAFNVLDWTVEQLGVVETFVVLVAGVVGGWFKRSQVTPVADPRGIEDRSIVEAAP